VSHHEALPHEIFIFTRPFPNKNDKLFQAQQCHKIKQHIIPNYLTATQNNRNNAWVSQILRTGARAAD